MFSLPVPPARIAACRALLAVLMVAATSQDVQSQSPLSPEQLRRERQDLLIGIEQTVPMDLVEAMRTQCASGTDVKATARSRRLGMEEAPDASDSCPVALARVARDGDLLALYRDLVAKGGGRSDAYRDVPADIGAAVMKAGAQQVAIGNGRAAVVTSALAWDAGFTVAYQKRERLSPSMPGLATLKPLSERCLDRAEPDLSLCFTTGYMYGIRAAAGVPVRPQ